MAETKNTATIGFENKSGMRLAYCTAMWMHRNLQTIQDDESINGQRKELD